jgi:tRNA dimethylallyltransferase
MPAVAAIFGPTAAGKSALAAEVAARAGGEVITADAMSLYRGLPILTAQPGAGEQRRAPHRLLGLWPLDHVGAVGEYAAEAHEAVDAALAAGRLPVLAGGTGLYLRAALVDLELPPAVGPDEREAAQRLYDEGGAVAAHARLQERDPLAAAVVHPNDRRRVVRALELAAVGASLRPASDRLWSEAMRRPAALFSLEWPRDVLDARIADRTRAMLDAGAVDEVAGVLHEGPPLSATAARIMGLAEITAHLRGEIDRDECERRIVTRTRRYARRQEAWARRLPGRVVLAGADGAEQNATRVLETLAP